MKKWLPTLFVWILILSVMIAAMIFIGRPTSSKCMPENMPEFMTWAFGEDWKIVAKDMKNIPTKWNERHGDLFKLHLNDRVDESQARMYEAWKKSKSK